MTTAKQNQKSELEAGNKERYRLFKKLDSNFQIKDRTVLFEPRGAWRILAESGFWGGMQNRRRFALTIFLLQS